jgi:hypothetical protein
VRTVGPAQAAAPPPEALGWVQGDVWAQAELQRRAVGCVGAVVAAKPAAGSSRAGGPRQAAIQTQDANELEAAGLPWFSAQAHELEQALLIPPFR